MSLNISSNILIIIIIIITIIIFDYIEGVCVGFQRKTLSCLLWRLIGSIGFDRIELTAIDRCVCVCVCVCLCVVSKARNL